MTLETLLVVLAAALIVLAAVPVAQARRRWRRLVGKRSEPIRRRETARRRIVPRMAGRTRWRAFAAASGALSLGSVLSGPVAGVVAAAYSAGAVVVLRRLARAKAESGARVAAVDAVAALAAELRAGVAVEPALATIWASLEGPAVVGAGAAAVRARLLSAVELAETSGAPLADVLDRLDVHLRAAERARAMAEAQAAGALASAGLLAVMPVAGAGLGILIGIDPAHVLLHTPIGAACLCGAVVLQIAGLAWSARLSRVQVPA